MRPPKSLFTAFLLIIALLMGPFGANSLNAGTPVSLNPLNTLNPGYCPHASTGTATYDLASALTNTSSSAIDLGLVGCFSFSITTTANAVQIWIGNNGNTYTAGSLYGTAASGCYSMPKVARYVWFTVPALSTNISGPNYVTPTASKTSVWHFIPTNWPN